MSGQCYLWGVPIILIAHCTVTQIPLDTAERGPERDQNRPPWIRPVRKKASSAPRTADSVSEQHSSPEAFSPSEFFADAGTPQSLPHLQTSFNPSPQSPGSAQLPGSFSAAHPLHQQYSAGGGDSSLVHRSSFMDTTSSINLEDPSMYMLSSDVMALFNDGNVDMASLFQPSANFSPNPARSGMPYGLANGESKRMMGFVSSSP